MIDPRQCEQARLARDPRFDGLFFTGVLSTGIYCRPICPAPAPKAENVVYFPSAAAAAEAGLRPCLRCRPEAAPGTPAWNGTSATVARGLSLIRQGALNHGNLEQMAARLGVGSRHLRRLFKAHIGASPTAIANTQRIQFAKKLLDETRLPITQVAFAAGFGSIRRFNAAFRKAFGGTPTDMRRRDRETPTQASDSFKCALSLPYRPPFDWEGMLTFLRFRAIPGVECVTSDSYIRTVRIGETKGSMTIHRHAKRAALVAQLRLSDSNRLMEIVERIRRIFDLDANMEAIYAVLNRDPLLKKAIAKHPGFRLPGAWEPFEIVLRAIVGQQISVKAARTICGRIIERAGKVFESQANRGLKFFFPTIDELLRADLTGVGLTEKRHTYLLALCKSILTDDAILAVGGRLPDLIQQLTDLPGIGDWTANYIAMRGLGEPDAFPANDLGIIKALVGEEKRPSRNRILERSQNWRPWRAYAAVYLWRGCE
jgi:AraC family transcriptional regulator of adaptative response / DNA-3-methyladenine glycosylase II